MIGEIVESNTVTFVAEAIKDVEAPAFGSWVEIATERGEIVYGVVSLIEYGSVIPGRRASALGMSREALRLEMPQVKELLRVSFHGRIVGYRSPSAEEVIQALPPHPAGIHDFVRPCSAETLLLFGPPYDFLRLLIEGSDRSIPGDELLVAVLAHMGERYHRDENQRFLTGAGRVLSRLLSDEPDRLRTILRRIQ